jgi:hypothetical protein
MGTIPVTVANGSRVGTGTGANKLGIANAAAGGANAAGGGMNANAGGGTNANAAAGGANANNAAAQTTNAAQAPADAAAVHDAAQQPATGAVDMHLLQALTESADFAGNNAPMGGKMARQGRSTRTSSRLASPATTLPWVWKMARRWERSTRTSFRMEATGSTSLSASTICITQ